MKAEQTNFEVGERVSFKKLKGGKIIAGQITGFKTDKPTQNIYARVKCDETGKLLLVQIKKLEKDFIIKK